MRQQIDSTTLEQMVVAKVTDMVNAGNEFTAYGITLALRADNPDVEIPHADVRGIVRAHMGNVGGYTTTIADFGTVQAAKWLPAPNPVIAPAPAPAPATGIIARIGALIPWGKK
jgi:hypothetical protein